MMLSESLSLVGSGFHVSPYDLFHGFIMFLHTHFSLLECPSASACWANFYSSLRTHLSHHLLVELPLASSVSLGFCMMFFPCHGLPPSSFLLLFMCYLYTLLSSSESLLKCHFLHESFSYHPSKNHLSRHSLSSPQPCLLMHFHCCLLPHQNVCFLRAWTQVCFGYCCNPSI